MMDVEDVTQDVFLAVLCSLPNFRGEAQFTTWLRSLTDHKVAEYYRRRFRKIETMQVDFIHAEECSDESSMSSLDDRIVFQAALNILPKQYCEVIILRFAEEMPFNEIACQIKKNPEATKSLFRRAISALRGKIDAKDEQISKR
jgi:RNA polymerase sigma-70 factor (ECF subfamily)